MKELQLEHGNYTRIVNRLLEEFIKLPLTGSEFAVFLFVIRKTYGFNKLGDEISLTQFEQGTNRTRPTVVKALKNLQLVNILKLVKKGKSFKCMNHYRLNKYYHTWKLVNISKLVKDRTSTSKEKLKKLVNIPLHTKDNTKDNTKERHKIPPTLETVTAYCTERANNVNPDAFINHYTAKGWLIGKSKMVDWKAAVRTWESKEKKQPVWGDL